MEKEFVTYNQALKLKALGFDESCFAYYNKEVNWNLCWKSNSVEPYNHNDITKYDSLSAPTYSAAFRWFREKYSLCIVIKPIDDKKLELGYNLTKNGLIMGAYTLYEKAELACLDKLIEIVEKNNLEL